MPLRRVASARSALPLLLVVALLPSCSALQGEAAADVAGIGGAAVSDALGASGAAAAGIGLGVRAVTRAGLQYAQRRVRAAAQDRIATVAGPLRPGQVAAWSTDHALPLEPEERGRVAVTRTVSHDPLACKEIVFSVDVREREEDAARGFYTATICRAGTTWRWATAEPAVARWGNLQ
ncbi:hypothetical protein ACE7GA_11460 [Roseomonas sp. CCTCC AB2023176]|uniref:hypothetical protein n=1 Tax=Roseomonas sp. CCTCC AB2023176 TaxID=3342640 RepID=UPI0035DD5B13